MVFLELYSAIDDRTPPVPTLDLQAFAASESVITVSGLRGWVDTKTALASVTVYCGETDPQSASTIEEWVELASTLSLHVAVVGGVAVDSVDVVGLTAETSYYIRVFAKDIVGNQAIAPVAVEAEVAPELRVASSSRTGGEYTASDSGLCNTSECGWSWCKAPINGSNST